MISLPNRSRGFTLLELLVVIVIAGIILGLATVNATPDAQRQLRDEAQALALRFQSAHEEARLRAGSVVWESSTARYRFLARAGGQWQPLRDDILREHVWKMPLSGIAVTPASPGGARIVFTREATAPPFSLTLQRDGKMARIVSDGSGRFDVE